MNSRLEAYLEYVAVRTKAMPVPERQRQMAELRQHLEALIAAHLEMGANEDTATEAALRQFGNAEIVGKRLAWAYRLAKWRQWFGRPSVAVAFTVAAFSAAPPLLGLFPEDIWYLLGIRLSPNEHIWTTYLYLSTEPSLWLFGIAIGLFLHTLAPRSSVRCVAAGYLLTLIGVYIWAGAYHWMGWVTHPLATLVHMAPTATIYGSLATGTAMAFRMAQSGFRSKRRHA